MLPAIFVKKSNFFFLSNFNFNKQILYGEWIITGIKVKYGLNLKICVGMRFFYTGCITIYTENVNYIGIFK